MMLKDLLKKSPEEAFIYLERRMNNENFPADIAEDYKPHSGIDKFELPFVLLDLDEVNHFEVGPDKRLVESLYVGNKIRFFVHPEMHQDYKNKGLIRLASKDGSINVSPTSSTRTVFTREKGYNFMIKTDLEKKLGDGIKKLKGKHLEHIKNIGVEFEQANLPKCFSYLPESIGAVYYSNGKEVGMFAREFNTRPKIGTSRKYILPFFSLFSLDTTNKKDPFLLCQIMENVNKKRGLELSLFSERILEPYLNAWAYLILERGLVLEMHAQNTLLEIDEKGNPLRIVYRDFQDVFIDTEIRRAKRLHSDFNRNIVGQAERTYKIGNEIIKDSKKCRQISYSLSYDYRMGRALDYFSNAMGKGNLCIEKEIINATKEIWKKHFGGTDIFPQRAYHLKSGQNNLEKELVFVEVDPKYR